LHATVVQPLIFSLLTASVLALPVSRPNRFLLTPKPLPVPALKAAHQPGERLVKFKESAPVALHEQVRANYGGKNWLGLAEGARESKESWLELLRQRKARGVNEPALAIGDGAFGFWAAASGTLGQTLLWILSGLVLGLSLCSIGGMWWQCWREAHLTPRRVRATKRLFGRADARRTKAQAAQRVFQPGICA
jgi:hypothetical protein